jgi:hypothetical protein
MVCEQEQRDILVMSSGDKLNLATTSIELSPVWCAHEWPITSPESAKRILHIKGFGGGVPPNTETAAVKPRVGIARWQEVFVLCRNGAGRECGNAPGPFNFRGISQGGAMHTPSANCFVFLQKEFRN